MRRRGLAVDIGGTTVKYALVGGFRMWDTPR